MFFRIYEEDSRLSDERKREKRPEESAKMTGKQLHISENQVWLLEPGRILPGSDLGFSSEDVFPYLRGR